MGQVNGVRTLQIGMTAGSGGGGLNRFYGELPRWLFDYGIRCRGLACGSSRAATLDHMPVTTFAEQHASTSCRLFSAWRRGRQILRDEPFDLVASHFAMYAFPMLRSVGDRPLVCHFHGPWALESKFDDQFQKYGLWKSIVEKCVYARASHLITLSGAFAKVLEEEFRIRPDRIRVIPGGIDIDRFAISCARHEARDRLGWPADRPIVLAVRRLVRRMGLSDLIDAISLIRRSHPDVLVHICGQGKLRDALAARISAHGLSENVKLLGFVHDAHLPLMYRAADFSVVPTVKYEGFGLVAAESLAAGTPAVVTRVDGLPEVIGDLSEALIVERGSIAELADRISKILDGRLTLPTGGECQEHAARNFSWPRIAQRIAAVYREAVGCADYGGDAANPLSLSRSITGN